MPIIPATWEAEIGSHIKISSGKTVSKTISTNKPCVVVNVYNPNYMGSIVRRITAPGQPRQKT
jgi:hypothetical protein